MTWHRIQVAREEGEAISEVLAAASAPNRWATSAGLEALKVMGVPL